MAVVASLNTVTSAPTSIDNVFHSAKTKAITMPMKSVAFQVDLPSSFKRIELQSYLLFIQPIPPVTFARIQPHPGKRLKNQPATDAHNCVRSL